MSPFDSNIFELQPLEIRRLLTTASIDTGAILHVIGSGSADTITLNQLSNGKVSITGVTTQYTPGTQFTKILVEAGGGNDTVLITNNVTYTAATITGNAGNDSITGGKSADVIYGADGNDNLHGGVGDDWMDGNAGNDVMAGDDGAKDIVSYQDRTSAVRVTIDNTANDGQTSISETDNVQTTTEEVFTGSGNDTVTGSSASEVFKGGGGADSLTAGSGNDELTGEAGGDQMFGEQGDDYLHALDNTRDTVNGGTGPGATDLDLAEVDSVDVASASGSALTAGHVLAAAVNSPSDLDPLYGDGGKVLDFDLGFFPIASAVDSQGRVVYVGSVGQFRESESFDYDFAVARYNDDGSRDEDFGVRYIDFSNVAGPGSGYSHDDTAQAVTFDSDNNIIIVGYSEYFSEGENYHSDFAVAKLIASDGEVDGDFGDGGCVLVDGFSDSNDYGSDAVVQDNGDIVVVGTVDFDGTDVAAFRLSGATGSRDSVFGDNGGIEFIDFDSSSEGSPHVALQTLSEDEGQQRIIIGADSNGLFNLARLLPGGELDTEEFGDGGKAVQDVSGTLDEGFLNDIAVDGDNNIIAVGGAQNFSAFSFSLTQGLPGPDDADENSVGIIAKFSDAGSFLDALTHNSPESSSASFGAVTVDSLGRYVAVGSDNSDFLVVRVLSDLLPDPAFSPTGTTTTDFDGLSDHAFATRVLDNQKIMAAGYSQSEGTVASIARYLGSQSDPLDVEEYTNYDDLHQIPLPPDLQAVKDTHSNDSWFALLGQPDAQGVARINLDDLELNRNNNIKIYNLIAQDGKPNVVVNVDNLVFFFYDATTTTRIEIEGKGGNDSIIASNSILIPLIIDGGSGNDLIVGGGANDIIFGGTGFDAINGNNGADAIVGGDNSDALYGDGGRDIIIGGAAADAMAGGADEDIEIAGTTSYDTDVTALTNLIAEWSSANLNAVRIANIQTGGGLTGGSKLTATTVFNDSAIDVLTNDAGRDWFFARTTGPAATRDAILGGLGGDQFTAI